MAATNHSYGQEMLEKYQSYKKKVNKAIEEAKVFRIVGKYDWPRLRIELRRRGWVEKMLFTSDSDLVHFPQSILLEEAQPGNEFERALMTKMLGRTEPTFVWMASGTYYSRYLRTPILNKIYVKNCNFGCKDGLQQYFETIGDGGYHPRSYNVIGGLNLDTFEEDFLLTAAISVILYLDNNQSLVEKFSKKPDTIKWMFMLKLFEFVQFHIDNADCDMNVTHENSKNLGFGQDNKDLILALYDDVYKKHKCIELYHRNCQDHIPVIRTLAQRVRETWPKRFHDGYENIWLLKPAYSGQGNGIILSSDVAEITKMVKDDRERYVVQKYIERPLLIYDTKFDIRQYFLVTVHNNKLCGWAHSKCTIRLASEQFTFKKMSRQIHITNTSVQKRFRNKSNENLPDYHMWRVKDLMEYFWKMGKPHAWNEIIFPSIKSTLVTFMKSCVHNIELRPGRFEIFGCDWLITEDLKTYLLEINRSPSLYYYTSVSVDVVGTVMNDLIKVTVDYMKDESASTGGFELIYEMNFDELPFEPFTMDWATYNINRFRPKSPKDEDDLVSEPDIKGSCENLNDENVPQRNTTPPRIPPPPPPPPQNKMQKTLKDQTVTSLKDSILTCAPTSNNPAAIPIPSLTTTEATASTTTTETQKTVLMETTKANVIACYYPPLIPPSIKNNNNNNNIVSNSKSCENAEKNMQNGNSDENENEFEVKKSNPEANCKYIIPPASKRIRTTDGQMNSDSVCCSNGHHNGHTEYDGNIELCDQNVPLPPPEVLLSLDFDPYGESLITY